MSNSKCMKKLLYLFSIVVLIATISCNKTGSFSSEQLDQYMQLQVGKYIRYQLDSTLFVNFGQKDTTIYYQAKDVVDAAITDNLGRPGWRVIRYLRDTASTDETAWQPTATFMIVPTRETIEVIENNLRFQKLKLPVKEGYNWHGNTFLPTSPFEVLYPFSNDEDMQFWDYTYQDVDGSVTILNKDYANTLTVQHVADSVNVPITFPNGLAYKNYWVETYAKNIGLIYKEVSMWEYQPPNGGNPGYRTGFGLRMRIIDHN